MKLPMDILMFTVQIIRRYIICNYITLERPCQTSYTTKLFHAFDHDVNLHSHMYVGTIRYASA